MYQVILRLIGGGRPKLRQTTRSPKRGWTFQGICQVYLWGVMARELTLIYSTSTHSYQEYFPQLPFTKRYLLLSRVHRSRPSSTVRQSSTHSVVSLISSHALFTHQHKSLLCAGVERLRVAFLPSVGCSHGIFEGMWTGVHDSDRYVLAIVVGILTYGS